MTTETPASETQAETSAPQSPAGFTGPDIEPERLDADAVRVLLRLRQHGHEAYLVGGCVRDLLIGKEPKDFDIATNATPNQIKSLFRNCRLIGRRFRLAHVYFKLNDKQKLVQLLTQRGSNLNSLDSYMLLADYGIKMNDPDIATVAVNGAIVLTDGTDPRPYLKAVEVAEDVGDSKLATRRLRQAYTIAPNSLAVRNKVAEYGLALEPTTGEVHLRHHVSPNGYYRGRKVVKTKGE
jgi:ribosomal protein L32